MTPRHQDLIGELERWTFFGAQWRVVALSGEQTIVDLCTCMGAPVAGRAEGQRTAHRRHERGGPRHERVFEVWKQRGRRSPRSFVVRR